MSTRRSARLSAAAANGKSSPAPTTAPPAPPGSFPSKQTTRKRKALSDQLPSEQANGGSNAEDTTQGPAPAPATPSKRRAKAAPPATPTPSSARLMAEPATTTTTPKPKPAAVSRLADLNRTNAPLLSPETSRLVTARLPGTESESASESASPSKAPTTTTTTTTADSSNNLLEEACAHLIRVDPRMRPLIEAHPCRLFSPEGLAEPVDPFESLCSGIISQQVSGAAAKAIKKRFVELFFPPSPPPPGANEDGDGDGDEGEGENEKTEAKGDADGDGDGDGDADAGTDERRSNHHHHHQGEAAPPPPPPRRFPHPSQVAACPLDRLRSAGLSQRKAEYARGLAEQFVGGALSARLLADAPYEEVLARLTAVRGLGRWSAEMFACFALKRPDVFSLGDLGVQRGMAAFVGRDVARLKSGGGGKKWKYMSEREMRELSDRFAPYRSLFMWYMWRVEETDVSTME